MTSRPSPLVYLAPVEWAGPRQRPHESAAMFARRLPVLYVEPVASRNLRLRDLARAASWLGRRRGPAPPDGLRVTRFAHLPWTGRAADRLNLALLERQIGRLGLPPGYTLVYTTPSLLALAFLRETRPGRVVYGCMDNFPAFHRGSQAERMRRLETTLLGRCDLVVVSSEELRRRMEARHPRVLLAPNGADVEKIRALAADAGRPKELEGLSRPILGYAGTIGDWLDLDLLDSLASRWPEASLVLIGPWQARDRSLLRRANVRWLGARPHDELPAFLKHFDAGLIPFRVNELTRCVNPIKLYEYLASGLPVVSTALPEASNHRGLVSVASDAAGFEAELRRLLSPERDPAALRGARMEYAERFAWSRVLEPMREAVLAPGGRPA